MLETELKQAKAVKATLEGIWKELSQKVKSSEQLLASQRIENTIEREKLLSELQQKEKLVKELQHKVEVSEDIGQNMLETELKQTKAVKATLEEICKELTQEVESSEQSLVGQRIENSMERQKILDELEQKEKLVKELQHNVEVSEGAPERH
ncbi:uncharacterized protein [Ptychodera flava]|uniref:uncharacterized protein n=1 Tax=Ptychodera flava TaxID=63121 RepID=UPI003969DBEB